MSLKEVIEGLIDKYGSVNAAARGCGMPEGTLHRLYDEERPDPRLSTLRKLARGYEKPLVLDGDKGLTTRL